MSFTFISFADHKNLDDFPLKIFPSYNCNIYLPFYLLASGVYKQAADDEVDHFLFSIVAS